MMPRGIRFVSRCFRLSLFFGLFLGPVACDKHVVYVCRGPCRVVSPPSKRRNNRRVVLILGREMGLELEESDVKLEPVLDVSKHNTLSNPVKFKIKIKMKHSRCEFGQLKPPDASKYAAIAHVRRTAGNKVYSSTAVCSSLVLC